MAQKRRDSDLSSELYFSIYGNNRKLKAQKVKAYAFYKPLLESTTANNFVVAANETNEIFVSFKAGSESKVFTFDKVFYSNIPQDDFYLLAKAAIQDIIMGLNSYLILCKLAFPISLENRNTSEIDLSRNIIVNVLQELIVFVNKEENMDCSLHVSYFEMHDSEFIDLLNESAENRSIEMYENAEKDFVEIKGLIEKPLVDYEDIEKIFSKKPYRSKCTAACCHVLYFVSLVRRNINNDGLEFIKVGKLTLVCPAECKNNSFVNFNTSTDDCLLKLAEPEHTICCEGRMWNILNPVFRGKATSTVLIILSSVLYELEKDLRLLQFVSEMGKFITYPEIDLQLIVQNSIKEYAEEIQELQRDLDATIRGKSNRISHLLYRSYRNAFALENEKVKKLEGQALLLTDSVNLKKQQIISLQAALASKEAEIKEIEKSSEVLKLEVEKIKNENIVQKVSLKADEIINVKQMIITNELYIKKLKLQITKDNRNYEELTRSIHFLKNETASLLCDIAGQNTLQKNTLELLIADMNNTFAEFQALEKDLTTKLSNFLDIDVLIKTWKNCMENLISKFSSFIHEKHEHFASMELEQNASSTSHYASKDSIMDIIKNNRSEKGSFLKYYFSKLQVFCDSSFKMIAEISHQMDVIESCYKAEFKAISLAFNSTSETFKKFVDDVNKSLKSFGLYFAEQERQLLKMSDIISFHQRFKKQFGEKIDAIKGSLQDLKQIYLDYNDSSSGKWNEIQKDWQETLQKHTDLVDNLHLFQTEISKYLDNLPQQKMNTLEYSRLKDKTDDVENRIVQLLQIHKEMKGNLDEVFAIHQKTIDKELLEIQKCTTFKKTEIEKSSNALSAKIKASTSNFQDELRNIQQDSSKNKDRLIKDLDSLSSSVTFIEPIFDKYLSISNSILTKSEQSFKAMPSVSEDKKDLFLEENLFLDEWNVPTSTPNIPEKKEFNISKEKEKLICRMKSLAEQQMSQKPNISILDNEEKETKDTSTASLPNLRTHSKASQMTEKSFPRLKGRKK